VVNFALRLPREGNGLSIRTGENGFFDDGLRTGLSAGCARAVRVTSVRVGSKWNTRAD
jgi:hypothetical protein